MKKTFAALALAGTVALVSAVPALADHEAPTYPGGATEGTVSSGTVSDGGTVTFAGTGFEDNEPIAITAAPTAAPQAIGGSFSGGASLAVPAKIAVPFATQTFSTTADSNGAFSYTITLSEPGTYLLTAEGLTSGHTVSSTVSVLSASTGTQSGSTNSNAAGGSLADTGADFSLVLWSLVGAGALAAGATSVIVVRRRAKADGATV